MEHIQNNASLLGRRVRVYLVGVGGVGAQMAGCLVRLDAVMRARGHPFGMHVTAFDPGTVRPAVVGRQTFSTADIGHNKAILQIHRLNQFGGCDWEAYPISIETMWAERSGRGRQSGTIPDILISCVDSRASRRAIHHYYYGSVSTPLYWLDIGNGSDGSGQVVLGQLATHKSTAVGCQRLPCVTELFPDLLDPSVIDDNRPSCSVSESVRTQGLFVNDLGARFGAQLLFELLTNGRLRHHGVFFSTESKRSAPIDVDAATWRRYGMSVADPANVEGGLTAGSHNQTQDGAAGAVAHRG